MKKKFTIVLLVVMLLASCEKQHIINDSTTSNNITDITNIELTESFNGTYSQKKVIEENNDISNEKNNMNTADNIDKSNHKPEDNIRIIASMMYGEYYVLGIWINNIYHNNFDKIIKDNIDLKFTSFNQIKDVKTLSGSIIKDEDGYYKFIPKEELYGEGIGINIVDMSMPEINFYNEKEDIQQYEDIVRSYLKSVKLSNAGVRVRDVIEVDLDEDGITERIIQATNNYSEIIPNNKEEYNVDDTKNLIYDEIGAYTVNLLEHNGKVQVIDEAIVPFNEIDFREISDKEVIEEGEKYRAEYETIWAGVPWMIEEKWWDGRLNFDYYIELNNKNGEYRFYKPYCFGQKETWYNLEKIIPKEYIGILDIDGDGVLEIVTLESCNMYCIFEIYDYIDGKISKIDTMYLYQYK